MPKHSSFMTGIQGAIAEIKKAQAHVPTPKEFAAAVRELCARYRDALSRWGRYKVHFRPPARKKKDLEQHRRLWDQAEAAKHDLAQVATGLLGLHPEALGNQVARGRLGELLKAAAARPKSDPPPAAPLFPPQGAVILGTALLISPSKRKGKMKSKGTRR